MIKRLNILELHKTVNEKKARKNECYEKVLSICHKKILMATENKQLKCIFEVPEYIIGYPIFDLNSCIKFIVHALKINGFSIKYFFPKILYISWDFDEIKKQSEEEQLQIQYQQKASNIFNLKNNKIIQTSKELLKSSLNMKNSGKLALNIY